ncbi:MAG: hypothetical protein ACXAC7_16495 [Candidatus Hodarchaeales archaeon]|jgi:hypothetical protein
MINNFLLLHFRQYQQLFILLLNLLVLIILYFGIIVNIYLIVLYGSITIVLVDILVFFGQRNEKSPLKDLSFDEMFLIWNIDSFYILSILKYYGDNFISVIIIAFPLFFLGISFLAWITIFSEETKIAFQTIGAIITVLIILIILIIYVIGITSFN